MNILANDIGTEQAKSLIEVMNSNGSLKTLCAFSGNETELDLGNKGLSPGCGVLVANEVKNNGAMTSLNISSNDLGRYWDFSKREYISDMTGIKALAAAIPECK